MNINELDLITIKVDIDMVLLHGVERNPDYPRNCQLKIIEEMKIFQ